MTDDELDRRVRESVLSEEVDASRVEAAVRREIRSGRRRVAVWGAAAAALAIAIAGGLHYREAMPPVCAAAERDHQREIVEGAPRHWLTSISDIQSLAEKQGVPGETIAALASTGYRLERGRLCFLEKQVFLHLVYAREGSEYSVYLRPPDGGKGRSDSVRGSERVAYFETARVTAVFVGSAAGADAMAFAQAGARVL